jgi:carbamoylphosphate synthase large subunit
MGFSGPGIEAVSTTTDKSQFRRFQSKAGLACPRFARVTTADTTPQFENDWRWPLIAKSADSSGSRGVGIVAEPDDLASEIGVALSASRSGSAVVEEFVSGVEVGGDLLP